MLICHGKQFIFIHNYKVAGTSIREALQHLTIPPDESYKNWLFQKIGLLPASNRFPDHITAEQLRQKLPPKMFNNYFKFCFVRNPWDWQVSLYHYAIHEEGHHQQEMTRNMTFEEYLYWRVKDDKHLQREFMYDSNGNCLVDYIGKLENIVEDFNAICQKIGVDIKLPHSNKSPHKKYREYYTETTRALVEEHFKEDIETFDYTF